MPAPQREPSTVPFDFLNTEIDLGTTFVQLAETELSLGRSNPEHAARLLSKAREALRTVRHFLAAPALGLCAAEAARVAARSRRLAAAIKGVSAHAEIPPGGRNRTERPSKKLLPARQLR